MLQTCTRYRRSKLEDKREILIIILIGYRPTGAYKIYNPVTQEVHISRDRVVLGLGQPRKPDQTYPKKSKKMGWAGVSL